MGILKKSVFCAFYFAAIYYEEIVVEHIS